LPELTPYFCFFSVGVKLLCGIRDFRLYRADP
jgi:hypothetical protein